MTVWNITIQNNVTNEIRTSRGYAEEHELYLKFNYGGSQNWLDNLPDGEYTYYVWPLSTYSAMTIDTNNGGSTFLDYDVYNPHTGDRVKVRDLNPFVGLLRIGDVPVNTNTYDDTDNKRYYYEKD